MSNDYTLLEALLGTRNEGQYSAFMTKDLVHEFRSKEPDYGKKTNTQALIDAFAVQLDELLSVFADLETKTVFMRNGKYNESTVGAQLDGIGQIVDMSRKDATLLSGYLDLYTISENASAEIYANQFELASDDKKQTISEAFEKAYKEMLKDPERRYLFYYLLEDPAYRKFLDYKIFLNNSTATVSDVIRTLKMFWNGNRANAADYALHYQEIPERPATILLSTDTIGPDDNARLFFMIPIDAINKAAGVELLRKATTEYEPEGADTYLTPYMHNGVYQCQLPPIIETGDYEAAMLLSAEIWNVMQTRLDKTNHVYLEYEPIGDHEASLMSLGTTYTWDQTIPSMVDGRLITEIQSESIGSYMTHYLCLPPSIRNIQEWAFFMQSQMETIEFHAGVQHIGANAFKTARHLETVYFRGTKAQWDAIDIESGNDNLLNAKLITY